MKIRLKVREIAEQKGFNQSSLSRAANIDFKTVKRLFRDPYRDIAISTIVKVAWALNVTVDELIEVSEMPARWEKPTQENHQLHDINTQEKNNGF